MRCWRIDLRRNLLRYLDETLTESAIKRLEDHVLDCGECRTRLARIRTGHRIARKIPLFRLSRDLWPTIEAAIERGETLASQPLSRKPLSRKPLYRTGRQLSVYKFAIAILVVALLSVSILVWIKQHSLLNSEQSQWAEPPIDRGEFHAVDIADIERNTEPHVVAEGYVAEVRINDEDGDLSFKLVENLQQAEPFIVCEIIDPIKLRPPPVGSRVRVYGVSRYDGKVDHRWYEVHPVLNIEMVKHRD